MRNAFPFVAVSLLLVAACAPHVTAAEASAALKAGDPAPDFSLPASTGGNISLKDLRGRTVVLYFYPKDDTPGCTVEAKGFRDYAEDFAKIGAVVLGVSTDDLKSHAHFTDKFHLNFALLSDPDGLVHDAYGAWKQGSIFGHTALGVDRSTFVIDGEGVVRRVWHGVDPQGHAAAVLEFVKSLQHVH